MQELKIIEYNNVRVLTTKQLAEAYGTDGKTISKNFNRNKSRYNEGKHYIRLSGQEKVDFINHRQFGDGSNKAKYLYLWTEKGSFLHAKSLNTENAWTVYERLVDFYFEKKQELKKEELHEPHALYIPDHASVPAPLRTSWYSRNKDLIWEICENQGYDHQELYHRILSKLSQTYDIRAAREIYKNDRGFYPEYAIDIVGYFPEMEAMADEYMKGLL